RNARRPRHEPKLPEKLTAWQAEAVAGTALGERAQLVLREPRLLRELAYRRVRAVGGHDLCGVLSQPGHVLEYHTHGTVLDRAPGAAAVHVGRPRLHSALLSVADERRGRIEAHRLRVEQRGEELGSVVVP